MSIALTRPMRVGTHLSAHACPPFARQFDSSDAPLIPTSAGGALTFEIAKIGALLLGQ